MQRVFEALTSATRRDMLSHLAAGELNASDIAARFEMSKPAISQHLAILEGAGLVTREKRGQFVFFRQAPRALSETLTGYLRAACPGFEAPKPPKEKKRKKGKKLSRETPSKLP